MRSRQLRACPCGDWHSQDVACPDLLDQAVDSVAYFLVDNPDALPVPPDTYQVVLDQLDAR